MVNGVFYSSFPRTEFVEILIGSIGIKNLVVISQGATCPDYQKFLDFVLEMPV